MTTKWLWACTRDGVQVETVLMRYPTRATVCVSSQAGCAMGCTFCATGQAGFTRHLDPAEIVEQVLRAAHASPQRVRNVVFMGMGEPLANYDATWAAIERLHDDVGISARRITVSTVGVVPGIRRLALERLPVTLAVSLHAASDERRSELVPLNRRYPIAEVLDAAADYAGARGRRISFEYACIAGVNDSADEAEGARAAPGRVPRCRRRAREPDSTQPDGRIRRRCHRHASAAGVRRAAPVVAGSPQRCAETVVPTSPRRAGNSARGRRSRVRGADR